MDASPLTTALEETLSLFDGEGTPRTTSEVAEELDLGRRSTYERLDRLVEHGRLETKKVGASARVWWRPPTPGEPSATASPDEVAGRADEGPERSDPLVEQLFAASPVGLAVFGPNGVERANERATDLVGLSAGDDREAGDWSVHSPADASAASDAHASATTDGPVASLVDGVFETGEPLRGRERRVRTPSGERRWVSVDAKPVTEGGEAVRVVVAVSDVTAFKQRVGRLERQRGELAHQLEEIFERVDDAFFALDREWRFTYVNEQAATMLDRPRDELVGESVWEQFPEAVGTRFQAEYERARETGETVSLEEYYPPLDRWFEVTAYPSESGLSVYFRNVTERKERERELERYETILETVSDGVCVMDEAGRFTMVNDAYTEMMGYAKADLLGEHRETVVSEAVADRAAAIQEELVAGERETARMEAEIETADGDTLYAEGTFALIDPEDGPSERVGVIRDITDRREREEELERYRAVIETIDDGVYVVDDESRFLLVNEAHAELTGYDREELLGSHASMVTTQDDLELAEQRRDQLVADGQDVARVETELVASDGSRVPVETRFALFPLGDDRHGRVGVVRDITDRRERERELHRRVTQQEAVADLGRRALEDREVDDLMAEAADLVADVLDTDYCKVLDLDGDAEELLLRQGVGWDEGIVGEATVSAVEDDSQAAYTLASTDPVVVEDLATEARFSGPELLTSHDVRSGISVVIGPDDDPWGILGTHDTDRRTFSDHDVTFVQSVANTLATAITRHRDELALVRQREQLAALNDLNRTIRETTDAIIDQSTRTEIERTVCEYLTNAESYTFAWIGEVDVASQTVEPRAAVGADGYLDEVTVTVDPTDERSEGPTGRALRTGETQTVQNIDAADTHDPWRDQVREYGFRSAAAVPVAYDGTTYGVLNVYADRPNAFERRERAVIDQLGAVVGHAIAATERKRALMSDEVVELEFRIEGILGALDVDGDATGTVAIEHVVAVEDDEFRVFGHADETGVGTVDALVEALPHWTDVTVRGEGEQPNFEAHLSEPPVLSSLASVGGSVERAVIEDGDYWMRIHVSPGTDVRQLIDTVKESYPAATLLKRRQRSNHEDRGYRPDLLTSELTDRQRTALETAYFAGFFEWPREADGTDVADSLGVSPPTVHQHLRKAERKVFDALFSAAPDA